MPKHVHEIRDPIHVFIRMDTQERRVVDSPAFQRLRHVHQLALSHLVYPAATHMRFEHCLGVMELAGRVYDVLTHQEHLARVQSSNIPGLEERQYWRRVLRMAALCHDLGHLPFSHAAEHELLPDGWDHERLSVALILSESMRDLWASLVPPLNPEHVAKLAVGTKKQKHVEAMTGKPIVFNEWESLVSEIIVGDAFGVDRMDYLLRDSHHAGVPYGRFDHYRLIDTLRILPKGGESEEPVLGVEFGGLHAAEALLLARRFMFIQVYMHQVRRIYDVHLRDFLQRSPHSGSGT